MAKCERIYNVNHNFFKNIDSEKQAYVLGFLYADGCVHKDMLSFGQSEDRAELVNDVNTVLGSTYSIRKSIPKKGKPFYEVHIKSGTIVEDLRALGIIENKSLVLKFPDFLPDPLMRHFIRGVFDGDGCVWEGKRKKITVKNENVPGEFRDRISQNVKFTVTGNYDFINSLQNYLVKILGFKKNKLNFSKAKKTKHICTMEYSGRIQMAKFYNYIYKDASIFEKNKKLKFNTICASLGKPSVETALIEEKPEMVIVSQAVQLL